MVGIFDANSAINEAVEESISHISNMKEYLLKQSSAFQPEFQTLIAKVKRVDMLEKRRRQSLKFKKKHIS